jgi:hypothetical protein
VIATPFLYAPTVMRNSIGGELTFWSTLRIDPVNLALRLWTISADVEAGERTVFRARQRINLSKALAENRRPVFGRSAAPWQSWTDGLRKQRWGEHVVAGRRLRTCVDFGFAPRRKPSEPFWTAASSTA